jgi:large subunit ribosomal protein L17
MRHRVAHRKLGRVTEHRIAMLRNQASALIEHERIQTTVARAKELRPFVERIISVAKRSLSPAATVPHRVTARRVVSRDIADREVVTKLFDTIAPRFVDRPGGYTRLLRLGYRRGDSAEVAEVELIGSEYDPNKADKAAKADAAPDKPDQTKKKSMGGRIREALSGGRKKDGDDQGSKTKAGKAAKGPGKRSTTPRKVGGS